MPQNSIVTIDKNYVEQHLGDLINAKDDLTKFIVVDKLDNYLYNYKDKILQTLPQPIFEKYR